VLIINLAQMRFDVTNGAMFAGEVYAQAAYLSQINNSGPHFKGINACYLITKWLSPIEEHEHHKDRGN
jgi:hypothetical protein